MAETAVAHGKSISLAFAIDHAGLLDVAPAGSAAGGGINHLVPGGNFDHAVGEQKRVPDKFRRLEIDIGGIGSMKGGVFRRPIVRAGQNISAGAWTKGPRPGAAGEAALGA